MSHQQKQFIEWKNYDANYLLVRGDKESFHKILLFRCKAIWNQRLNGWLVLNKESNISQLKKIQSNKKAVPKNITEEYAESDTSDEDMRNFIPSSSDSETDIVDIEKFKEIINNKLTLLDKKYNKLFNHLKTHVQCNCENY